MVSFRSVSVLKKPKNQRRQQLKNQRSRKYWLTVLRTLSIGGIACGLFWLITLPKWTINNESQIEIENNQFLSKDEIVSLLPLEQPLYIYQINPKKLSEYLKINAPIAAAKIKRQLIPPKLKITITELKPVATVYTDKKQVGSVDKEGKFIERKFYTGDQNFNLPSLKLIGFKPEEQQQNWSEIYPLINSSPVKIYGINWEIPSNIVLITELGKVDLGPITSVSKFNQQLNVLAQLSSSEKINSSQIISIDLNNPDAPTIKIQKKDKNEDTN